ncbi:hypothetical protein K8369_28800, partial [Streptomyces sp. PSKA30]|nr:hypothetical protein [Streptomyces sp. PSKA30]
PTGDGAADDVSASPPASDEAAPTAPPGQEEPVRQAVAESEATGEPVLKILPLGSGLVLIGLGLGLAFLALRVRRSQG